MNDEMKLVLEDALGAKASVMIEIAKLKQIAGADWFGVANDAALRLNAKVEICAHDNSKAIITRL